jgi:neuroligin
MRLVYLRKLLPYLRNQSEDCLYLNIYAPVTGKNLLRASVAASSYHDIQI